MLTDYEEDEDAYAWSLILTTMISSKEGFAELDNDGFSLPVCGYSASLSA